MKFKLLNTMAIAMLILISAAQAEEQGLRLEGDEAAITEVVPPSDEQQEADIKEAVKMGLLNAKVHTDAEIFKLGWIEDLSHLIRVDKGYDKLIESRDPIKLTNNWHIEYIKVDPEDKNLVWNLSFAYTPKTKSEYRCYKNFKGYKNIIESGESGEWPW